MGTVSRANAFQLDNTYDGMSGAGKACPPAGLPPGTGGAVPNFYDKSSDSVIHYLMTFFYYLLVCLELLALVCHQQEEAVVLVRLNCPMNP